MAQQILQAANKAYQSQKWQEAVDGWAKLVKMGVAKDPSVFYLNSGYAYTNMQKFDKALEQIELCLGASPKNERAFAQKISILIKLKNYEGALGVMDQVLAGGGHSQITYIQRLNLFNMLARFEDSMECVEQALKMTKDEGKGPLSENLAFNVDVAFALCKLKSAEDLLPYTDFLEKQNKEGKLNGPTHRYHRIYVASMSIVAEFYAERDFGITYSYYSKLIAEEPKNASLRYNRGVVCRRKRQGMTHDQLIERLVLAVENFEEAAKLDPKHPKYQKAIGNGKLMQKDYYGAIDALKKAQQDDVKVLYNMGVCYLNLRKVQDSLIAMEAALKLDPKFAPALQALKLLKPIVKRRRALFQDLASRLRKFAPDSAEFKAALKEAQKAQGEVGLLDSQKAELRKICAEKGHIIKPVNEREEYEKAKSGAAQTDGAAMPPKLDGTKDATVNFDAENKDKDLPELKVADTPQEKKDQGQLFEIQVPKGVFGGDRICVDISDAKNPKGPKIASVVVPNGMKEFEMFKYNPLTGITVDNNNVITRQRVVPVDSMVLSKDGNSWLTPSGLSIPLAVGHLLTQSAHPYISLYKDLLKKKDEDLDWVELEIKRAILALGQGQHDLANFKELGHTKVVLTLAEILAEGGRKPKDFDIYNKEKYLSDKEFKKVFKMSRKAFEKLKRWRKNKLKKKLGLF